MMPRRISAPTRSERGGLARAASLPSLFHPLGRHRRPGLVGLLGLVVLTSLPVASSAWAQATATAGSVLDHPAYRSGDLETLRDVWWQEIAAAPNSLESQTRLLLWRRVFATRSHPAVSAAEWDQLAERITENGWSRRVVEWRSLEAHEREGQSADPSRTARERLARGNPARWAGVGPFGVAEAASLWRPLGPELFGEGRFDSDTEFSGSRGRTVRWREVQTFDEESRVSPRQSFARSGAVFFFTTSFDTDVDQTLWLQAVGGGSFRVWVDGTEVLTVDRYRAHRPSVVRRAIDVEAGRHRVLVKCDRQDFSLSWRDARGFAVELQDVAPLDTGGAASAVAGRVTPKTGDVARGLASSEWYSAWQAGTLADEKRWALIHVLAEEGDLIRTHEVIDAILEGESDPVARAQFVAPLLDVISYLPANWRRNQQVRWWTEALEREPTHVPLGLAMARHEFSEDKVSEAWSRVQSLRATQPRSLEVLLLAERIAAERNWDAERRSALEAIEALGASEPIDNPLALDRLLRHATEHGLANERARWLERIRRAAPDPRNVEAVARQWISMGRSRDDVHDLVAEVADAGDSLAAHQAESQLWEDLGEYPRSIEVARACCALRPDDAGALARLGSLEWARASTLDGEARSAALARAAAAYEDALEVEPGQIRWIQDLEFLRGAAKEPFWAPYALDSAAAIASPPGRDRYPRASAVLLIDQMVTRVRVDGGGEEMIHQVILLTSQEAVGEYSELSVAGDVELLRVITPGGEELHPTANVGGGSFTLPGLAPGAIIEYRTVREFDLARERDLAIGPFYFRDPNATNAFHYTEWTVLLPESWRPRIIETELPSPREERTVGGYRELRWAYREMEHLTPEFRSPPADVVLPNVRIASEQSWAETIELVQGNRGPAHRVTPVLKQAAEEICAGLDDPRAKVEALYAAVCDRIKTEAGGSEATEIWIEQGGSRDVALAGLLAAAGIDFDWVYSARAESTRPFADWSEPSANHFQFALIRVDLGGNPLYVSAAFRRAEAGRIPQLAQGGRALAVSATDPRLPPNWLTLPTQPRDDEARVARARIDLRESPTRVTGSLELRMLAASRLKDQFAGLTQFQRQSGVEGMARQAFAGARSVRGSVLGVEERDEPLIVRFELESGQLLDETQVGTFVRPIYFPAMLRRSFVRQGERTTQYVGDSFDTVIEVNEIELGDRYEVDRLPEDLDLVGPWGTYQVAYRRRGTTIEVRRRMALEPFVIDADEVADLYEFCSEVDRKEGERIRLRAR